VEEIREQAYAGIMALPRRGLEIGGFLTLPAGESSTGEAASLHLVVCEYRFGPCYSPSPADLLALKSEVREQRKSGNLAAAYFRSCTGNSVEMTPEDVSTLKAVFPDVGLMLIAKPHKSGSVSFSLFRQNAEGVWSGPQDPKLSGTSQTPEEPAYAAVAEENPAPSMALPIAPAAMVVESKVEPGRSNLFGPFRNNRLLVFAFILAVFSILAAAAWQRYSQPLRTGVLPGLRVVSEGGSMRVTWDRSLGLDRTSKAKLTIKDGESVREVLLDAAQIASGSVVYTPNSNDVAFQMQVQAANLPVRSELVRVLSGRTPDTRASVPVAAPKPAPASKPAPANLPAIVPKPEKSIAASTLAPPINDLPAAKQPFQPPQNLAGKDRAQQERQPLEPEIPPAGLVRHAFALALPEPPPLIPRPNNPPPSQSVVRPPIPIRKVIPAADGLGWKVNYPVDVSIQVTVDLSGRVIAAREAPSGTPRTLSLVTVGLRAAREWTFTPGTRDGRPVSAEHIIVFHFSPH